MGADGFSWTGSDGVTCAATDAAVTISVTPTVSALTKTVAEEAVLAFASSDFTSHFAEPNGNLQTVKITTRFCRCMANWSFLERRSRSIKRSQREGLGNLTYQGNVAYSGTDSFSWTGSDGVVYAASDAAATLTITPVDHPPVVFDFSEAVAEEAVLTFTVSDFAAHFADSDPGDSLQTVKITTLPATASLNSGRPRSRPAKGSAAVSLGGLTYQGAAGWADEDSFSWKGSDGTAYSVDAATVTLVIAPIDHSPVGPGFPENDDGGGRTGFCRGRFRYPFHRFRFRRRSPDGRSHGTAQSRHTHALGDGSQSRQDIQAADLDDLTYQGGTDHATTDSFSWTASDGVCSSRREATVTIAIAVPPTVSAFTTTVGSNGEAAFEFERVCREFRRLRIEPRYGTDRRDSPSRRPEAGNRDRHSRSNDRGGGPG